VIYAKIYKYFSAIWRKFVPPFGAISIRHLAVFCSVIWRILLTTFSAAIALGRQDISGTRATMFALCSSIRRCIPPQCARRHQLH